MNSRNRSRTGHREIRCALTPYRVGQEPGQCSSKTPGRKECRKMKSVGVLSRLTTSAPLRLCARMTTWGRFANLLLTKTLNDSRFSDAILGLPFQLQPDVGFAIHLYQTGSGSGRLPFHGLGPDDASHTDALSPDPV